MRTNTRLSYLLPGIQFPRIFFRLKLIIPKNKRQMLLMLFEVCVITSDRMTSVSYLSLDLEVLRRLAFTQSDLRRVIRKCVSQTSDDLAHVKNVLLNHSPKHIHLTPLSRFRLNLWSLTHAEAVGHRWRWRSARNVFIRGSCREPFKDRVLLCVCSFFLQLSNTVGRCGCQ